MNTFRCIALMALSLAPAALTAQARPDTARLGDLTVTATRVPVPEGAVPAATTVLKGDDLRARGVTFLIDALREVPGMMVVQTGSYGAVTSLFLRGGNSDYDKVLLVGVPLNLPGRSINLANVTIADLDRIEIVRGPASVLYGADAMSGVVQLFTRPATGSAQADFSARAGTFGTTDLSAHVAKPSQQVSFSATASRVASDGSYAFNSGYRNTVASMQVGVGAGTAEQSIFTVRYGTGTTHFPTDGNGNVVDHNQFTTEQSLAVGLDVDRTMDEATSLHLHGFASRLNSGATNRMDTPADTSGFDYIDDANSTAWRRGFDARLDKRIHAAAVISLGVGLEHETDDATDMGVSNFGFGASTDTANFSAARTTRDAYVQLLTDPDAKLSLQGGGRVDDNSAFGTFKTWRGALTWRPVPSLRIWGAAGTAFKAPTFPQLFARSAFEIGNPDLTPERSRNSEAGSEVRLPNHRLTVGATVFWQQFQDLIQYVFVAAGAPNYFNLGAAKARGLEATVTAVPVPGLTLSAHWTWLHTQVTDTGSAPSVTFQQGSPLIRRPASSGGGTAAYRRHGLTLAGTLTRVGARDDVDFSGAAASRVILPGYTTVDVALALPVRRAAAGATGIELTLRSENLFAAKYWQAVGYPGRGRAFLAGARLQY